MEVAHFDLDGLGWVGVGAVSSCLLHKLASMHKDEGLISSIFRRLDTVNKLSENDLLSVQHSPIESTSHLTVLPLPVANDIPSLL